MIRPALSSYRQAKLALFDTALLLDDSGSMAFSKWNGERLDDLNVRPSLCRLRHRPRRIS